MKTGSCGQSTDGPVSRLRRQSRSELDRRFGHVSIASIHDVCHYRCPCYGHTQIVLAFDDGVTNARLDRVALYPRTSELHLKQ